MVLSGRWSALRASKLRKKKGRVIKRAREINFRKFVDEPFTSRLYGDVPKAIEVVNSGEECKTCYRFTSCPFECYMDCLESRVNYWFYPTLFNFDREQGRVID